MYAIFLGFLAIFRSLRLFLMPMSGTDGVHHCVEIRAEREGVAQVVVVLRIFAILISKGQESQTAVIEGEDGGHACQIVHAEMTERDA